MNNSRDSEEAAFRAYLADVQRVVDLPASQAAERAGVEREASAVLDDALTAEREVKDAAAAARRALDSAESRISRLAVRSAAGAAEADVAPLGGPPPSQLPERLGEVAAATASLLGDLRAAEASWDWVERTRQADTAAHRVSAAPPTIRTAPDNGAPARGATGSSNGCSMLGLILVASLGILAILLSILIP